MLLGRIVKSNSHVDYVCHIYGVGEVPDPPAPDDYAFGRWVRIATGRQGRHPGEDAPGAVALDTPVQTHVVGVIYNTQLINPDYGAGGPRLSPERELEFFAPDYLSERAVLVVVDVQRAFAKAVANFDGVAQATRKLIQAAHLLELPVVVTGGTHRRRRGGDDGRRRSGALSLPDGWPAGGARGALRVSAAAGRAEQPGRTRPGAADHRRPGATVPRPGAAPGPLKEQPGLEDPRGGRAMSTADATTLVAFSQTGAPARGLCVGTAKGPGQSPHEYTFITPDRGMRVKQGEFVYYELAYSGETLQVIGRVSGRRQVRLYPDTFMADPEVPPGQVAAVLGFDSAEYELFEVTVTVMGYYDARLKPRAGTEPEVARYVFSRKEDEPFYRALMTTAGLAAEGARENGRAAYTVAVGCTGGRHRSVAVAERLAQDMGGRFRVEVEHRDVGKGD
ncbi:MAG: hypothetical protein C4289_05845 [Chloroflexota bacterium]